MRQKLTPRLQGFTNLLFVFLEWCVYKGTNCVWLKNHLELPPNRKYVLFKHHLGLPQLRKNKIQDK